jgi:uncharacterized protein YbjT (DUF2867 family)
MRMTTAFVAGATGYTGREVVRALRSQGIRTLAHVRPDSPHGASFGARFFALGAEPDSTPWRPEAMAATLARARPDLVFALLGTTRRRMRRAAAAGAEESYQTVDYGLTRMLLDAAVACGTRPRFVYLSSMGVSPRSQIPYVKVRARLEEELRRSGIPFTIVRPSFITGPDRDEDRPLERVGAALVNGVVGILARAGYHGADRWRSRTAAELAGALVRLALDPGAAGTTVESEALP